GLATQHFDGVSQDLFLVLIALSGQRGEDLVRAMVDPHHGVSLPFSGLSHLASGVAVIPKLRFSIRNCSLTGSVSERETRKNLNKRHLSRSPRIASVRNRPAAPTTQTGAPPSSRNKSAEAVPPIARNTARPSRRPGAGG